MQLQAPASTRACRGPRTREAGDGLSVLRLCFSSCQSPRLALLTCSPACGGSRDLSIPFSLGICFTFHPLKLPTEYATDIYE